MVDWGQVKNQVMRTEQRLHEEGLLIRLYGSVSCRIDEETMYMGGDDLREHALSQEEVRRVKFHRARGIAAVHAAIYRTRPDVNCVVYTRQCYGSALGVLKPDGLTAENAAGELIRIRVAPFSMPGSDAQRSHIRRMAARDKSAYFFIISGGGVLSFGATPEETIGAAVSLESFATEWLKQLARTQMGFGVVHGFDSVRSPEGIVYSQPDTPQRVREIHERIYAAHPDAGAIVHDKSEPALTISRLQGSLFPLFDDYILLGADARTTFVYDDGAYCAAVNEKEAGFAALSVEKSCIAQIAATRSDGARVISKRDVRRLNRNSHRK